MEYFFTGKYLERQGFYDDVKQIVFEFIGNNWHETPEFDEDEIEEIINESLPTIEEAAAEWANVNPTGTGSLELRNFLEAGFHVGVDTRASRWRSSLREEDLPNTQRPVSIWQNSTISPDQNRRSMEIGSPSDVDDILAELEEADMIPTIEEEEEDSDEELPTIEYGYEEDFGLNASSHEQYIFLSTRNPNRQLRSSPPAPLRPPVSIWQNSTITPERPGVITIEF